MACITLYKTVKWKLQVALNLLLSQLYLIIDKDSAPRSKNLIKTDVDFWCLASR